MYSSEKIDISELGKSLFLKEKGDKRIRWLCERYQGVRRGTEKVVTTVIPEWFLPNRQCS